MLEIHNLLKQPVRKLSLGERMKAELLAALLHRPDILFLDEPTLGLDVNAQSSVRRFLREYNRLHHSTILITSHYMADITALCPRVLLIHQGKLMYDGTLNGILHRFAPYREVQIELASEAPQLDLNAYGETVAREGRQARLLVERNGLTRTISRLLNEVDVADLTVTDPPIEEIIGRLFTQGLQE
jgi:ABC-2 type transport system ATP-binding protein